MSLGMILTGVLLVVKIMLKLYSILTQNYTYLYERVNLVFVFARKYFRPL